MTLLLKIAGISSIVLLACTILCGLWLKTHPGGDVNFHFQLSLVSVIVSLITIILFVVHIFNK